MITMKSSIGKMMIELFYPIYSTISRITILLYLTLFRYFFISQKLFCFIIHLLNKQFNLSRIVNYVQNDHSLLFERWYLKWLELFRWVRWLLPCIVSIRLHRDFLHFFNVHTTWQYHFRWFRCWWFSFDLRVGSWQWDPIGSVQLWPCCTGWVVAWVTPLRFWVVRIVFWVRFECNAWGWSWG